MKKVLLCDLIMMELKTVEAVINALGCSLGKRRGIQPWGLMSLLRCQRQHVNNWRRSGKFPAHIRPKIEKALEELGLTVTNDVFSEHKKYKQGKTDVMDA